MSERGKNNNKIKTRNYARSFYSVHCNTYPRDVLNSDVFHAFCEYELLLKKNVRKKKLFYGLFLSCRRKKNTKKIFKTEQQCQHVRPKIVKQRAH